MKKALLYIILALLVSCGAGSSGGSDSEASSKSSTTVVISDPTDDTQGSISHPVEFAIISDNTLYFNDGEFSEQSNVNPKPCGERCFTDGAQKVYFDEFGEVLGFVPIYTEPDFIIGDWIIENIAPDEALAMGGLRKDYTRVFFEGSEVGFWAFNQFKTDNAIKTNTGEIIVISGSSYHSVSSDIPSINHANKLLISEFDAELRTAEIDGQFVQWYTNYFNNAKQWLKLGNIWYSWNGYEFNEDLVEKANNLWSWNEGVKPITVTSPTVIAVGADEFFTYWIECNTGWLIAHLPLFDQITPVFRLYNGDGLRMSGIYKSASLKPFLKDGILYFNDSGLRKIDLGTGKVELVFGRDSEVWGW